MTRSVARSLCNSWTTCTFTCTVYFRYYYTVWQCRPTIYRSIERL